MNDRKARVEAERLDERKTEMIAKRVDERMTDAEKLAITMVVPSFRFGGNWAYLVESNTDYKGHLQLLRENKGSVNAYEITGGALVQMDRGFLVQNVNKIIPGAINKEFVDKSKEVAKKELINYKKFVKSMLEGKSRFLVDRHSYFELSIGLYCVNDTNIIKLNGVEYPAYKLDIKDAIGLLMEGNKTYNRPLLVRVVSRGQEGFMPLQTAIGKSEALMRGLILSDTHTGVFLKLRIPKR